MSDCPITKFLLLARTQRKLLSLFFLSFVLRCRGWAHSRQLMAEDGDAKAVEVSREDGETERRDDREEKVLDEK